MVRILYYISNYLKFYLIPDSNQGPLSQFSRSNNTPETIELRKGVSIRYILTGQDPRYLSNLTDVVRFAVDN